MEERNVPTVCLVNENFVNDALSAASSIGMPAVRFVKEPIVSEWNVMEDVKAGIIPLIDEIAGALIRPATEDELTPKPKETEKPQRTAFKGSHQEVNRFFYKRGWNDGLPIMLPTEEAVKEMLTGTDLPPDYEVGRLGPRSGKATVEKIAVNAVMAGALPTYMPLLIAGVEALAEPDAGLFGLALSTSSSTPFWIINGPVIKDIHVNHSYGTLSPGDIANASIGRAMGFIIKNIGGIRKGIEDMGVIGNTGKYSMVMAEDEEANPWEPLHVEHGFNREDCTITLSFPQFCQQMVAYGTDDKGILATVIYNVIPGRRGIFCLVMTPSLAKVLADGGWTKSDVKKYILENTTAPWYKHAEYWGCVQLEERRPPVNPYDPFPLLRSTSRRPDPIRIIVAGGVGSWVEIISGGTKWVTKKAKLPANWGELVKKYKNIVPNHLKY